MVSQYDYQVIVVELRRVRTKPRAGRYNLSIQIDGLGLAHEQIGKRAETPERRGGLSQKFQTRRRASVSRSKLPPPRDRGARRRRRRFFRLRRRPGKTTSPVSGLGL